MMMKFPTVDIQMLKISILTLNSPKEEISSHNFFGIFGREFPDKKFFCKKLKFSYAEGGGNCPSAPPPATTPLKVTSSYDHYYGANCSRERRVGGVHDGLVLDNGDAGAERRFDVDAGNVVGRRRVELLETVAQVRLPLLQDLVNRIHQWRAHRQLYHNDIR